MEDVMEELLQEEILDETDFNAHNNTIRINMQPVRRSSPSSPGVVSVSHFQRRTPVGSPLNSHHPSPILRSPLSPYIHVPGLMPTLSSSPTKSLQGSPAQHRLSRGSPASHRVSGKPYEKLQKVDGG